MLSGVFRRGGVTAARGVAVRIGENQELACVFNPASLSYEMVWKEMSLIKYKSTQLAPVRNFTRQEAVDLASIIKAGEFRVPLLVEEKQLIGASLGEDSEVFHSSCLDPQEFKRYMIKPILRTRKL